MSHPIEGGRIPLDLDKVFARGPLRRLSVVHGRSLSLTTEQAGMLIQSPNPEADYSLKGFLPLSPIFVVHEVYAQVSGNFV